MSLSSSQTCPADGLAARVSAVAGRGSALEQAVGQQQQQLLVHGARLMRGVASELLLLAYGAQPQPPGASSTWFLNLARENNPRLRVYTLQFNQLGLFPYQLAPEQLAVLTDAAIDRGRQTAQYSSTALLEVGIVEAKTLMQNHPLLAGQCRFEADFIPLAETGIQFLIISHVSYVTTEQHSRNPVTLAIGTAT